MPTKSAGALAKTPTEVVQLIARLYHDPEKPTLVTALKLADGTYAIQATIEPSVVEAKIVLPEKPKLVTP